MVLVTHSETRIDGMVISILVSVLNLKLGKYTMLLLECSMLDRIDSDLMLLNSVLQIVKMKRMKTMMDSDLSQTRMLLHLLLVLLWLQSRVTPLMMTFQMARKLSRRLRCEKSLRVST